MGGAAGFVPLKDAGVVEHVAKHHADLLVQDVDGVVRRKLVGAAGKDVLGPCGVAAAKVVALERTGKVVAGIGLGCQQMLADSAKLGTRRGGRIARPMTSIRPMFSFLMWWYSACGWNTPSGCSSVVMLQRSAR